MHLASASSSMLVDSFIVIRTPISAVLVGSLPGLGDKTVIFFRLVSISETWMNPKTPARSSDISEGKPSSFNSTSLGTSTRATIECNSEEVSLVELMGSSLTT